MADHRPDIKSEDLVEMYSQGQTMAEIAKVFNCSIAAISLRLKRSNVESHQPRKGLVLDRVKSLYAQGLRQREIAKIFDCNRTAVTNFMKRHEIETDQGRYIRLYEKPEDYDSLYVSRQFVQLKKSILKERGRICEMCKSIEKIIIHHIVPRHCRPELFFDRDNLQILCSGCHDFMHHGVRS